MIGRTDLREALIVHILEAVSDGIFRSIVNESDENDGTKLDALMNTIGEDLISGESRAILNTLTPGYKEVSNPRNDLTPHTKITQLLDSKSMVDAVESLGEVRDYQRTNSIRFISAFVEHIKKLNQTVCSLGALNAPILITIKRTCDIFKDPPGDKPFYDLCQKSS